MENWKIKFGKSKIKAGRANFDGGEEIRGNNFGAALCGHHSHLAVYAKGFKVAGPQQFFGGPAGPVDLYIFPSDISHVA